MTKTVIYKKLFFEFYIIFFAKIVKSSLPVVVWLTKSAFPSVYGSKRNAEFLSYLFLT